MSAVAFVTLPADELRALIAQAVEAGIVGASRKKAAGVERVSAAQAAKIAKRRRSVILSACESGALPAKRNGARWSIKVADLDAWLAAAAS